MNSYTLKVSMLPRATLLRRIPFYGKNIHKHVVSLLLKKREFNKEIDFKKLNEEFGIFITKEFVEYKKYNQNYLLNIRGAIVWCKITSQLFVGNFHLGDKLKIEELLEELRHICKKAGVSSIHFQCSPGSRVDLILNEILIPDKGFSVTFKNISSDFKAEKLKFNFCDSDIF